MCGRRWSPLTISWSPRSMTATPSWRGDRAGGHQLDLDAHRDGRDAARPGPTRCPGPPERVRDAGIGDRHRHRLQRRTAVPPGQSRQCGERRTRPDLSRRGTPSAGEPRVTSEGPHRRRRGRARHSRHRSTGSSSPPPPITSHPRGSPSLPPAGSSSLTCTAASRAPSAANHDRQRRCRGVVSEPARSVHATICAMCGGSPPRMASVMNSRRKSWGM
jgi:hypothetical protein